VDDEKPDYELVIRSTTHQKGFMRERNSRKAISIAIIVLRATGTSKQTIGKNSPKNTILSRG
jgi:hypothetical protein